MKMGFASNVTHFTRPEVKFGQGNPYDFRTSHVDGGTRAPAGWQRVNLCMCVCVGFFLPTMHKTINVPWHGNRVCMWI